MASRPPTSLEFALLGLVHLHPQSGYDLRKIFETTAMGSYSSSPGAIYPALRRLEERGLLEGEVERPASLRPRKVFSPTPAGSEVLCGWLRQDVTRQEVARRLGELMLRFAFHSILADAGATRRFLLTFARKIDAYVAELEIQRASIPEAAPPHGRLALECGIEQYGAHARWAREAIRRFPEEES